MFNYLAILVVDQVFDLHGKKLLIFKAIAKKILCESKEWFFCYHLSFFILVFLKIVLIARFDFINLIFSYLNFVVKLDTFIKLYSLDFQHLTSDIWFPVWVSKFGSSIFETFSISALQFSNLATSRFPGNLYITLKTKKMKIFK